MSKVAQPQSRPIRPTPSRNSNFIADVPKTIYSQAAADFRPPADYVGPQKSRLERPPDPSMNPSRKNSLPILAVSKLNVPNSKVSPIKAPPSSKTTLPRVCQPLHIPSNCGVHGAKSYAKHTLSLGDTRKALMRTLPSYHKSAGSRKKKKSLVAPPKHFTHYDFHEPEPPEASLLYGIILLGGDHRQMTEEAPQEPVTPPPLSGRKHCIAQTDVYVENIADNEAEFESTEMQCEPIFDELLEPPPLNVLKQGLAFNGTQLDQWTFTGLEHAFDQTAVNLSEAVIMESLKQLQEEYELEALRKQHEYHKCVRNREIALLVKYKTAQAKHEEQKKYLESHKPWDQTLYQIIQMVGFNKIRDIAPTHFLDSQTDQAIYELVHEEMEPYLQSGAVEALAGTKSGRELLDSIIEDATLRREAEYAGRMYIGDPTKKGSLATNSPMSFEYEEEWEGEFDVNLLNESAPEEDDNVPPLTPAQDDQAYQRDYEKRISKKSRGEGEIPETSSTDRKSQSQSVRSADDEYDDEYDGDEDDL